MRDLSMHVLDIAQNSISAKADNVFIRFHITTDRIMAITITDDGFGMSPELLQKVTDPFTTTRTTRRVGLGIPMFKQSAELCGGTFSLKSKEGEGTVVEATFPLTHIDCLPMGEMCDTLLALVVLNPSRPDFVFEAVAPSASASFNTKEIRKALGGLPLNEPDIAAWMKESIYEEFKPILEG